MADLDGNIYREQRMANLKALEAFGYAPYGKAFARTGRLSEVRQTRGEGDRVAVAGRLTTTRDMGKSIFSDLRDGTDRFQIYVQKAALQESAFEAFKCLDIGDHVGVEGTIFTTRTGEKTIKVESWTLLSKALLPLPEKWHGLKDVEARYRQRYLDLIANQDAREVFNKRIRAVRAVREYLHERGFAEVETPMIQYQAGGAVAKPFRTHYEALGVDMFLRIAPELYLKRLLVGGFDKVYEMNRNFRNEGLSRSHNPEFTMLEVYEAYSDVNGMRELVQGMILHVAQTVFGTLVVQQGERQIDFTPPWEIVRYRDLILKQAGADWYDLPMEEARKRLEGMGLEADPVWDRTFLTHEIYEKIIEKNLIRPTFVVRFPTALVPLAKTCEDDPSVVDVFELVIGGMEVAPAYSELNDPFVQRRRLQEQAAGDSDKIDEDFLEALEHGMPPAGGMGVGIDRLVMLLAGCDTLRDVILFPQLKPRG